MLAIPCRFAGLTFCDVGRLLRFRWELRVLRGPLLNTTGEEEVMASTILSLDSKQSEVGEEVYCRWTADDVKIAELPGCLKESCHCALLQRDELQEPATRRLSSLPRFPEFSAGCRCLSVYCTGVMTGNQVTA